MYSLISAYGLPSALGSPWVNVDTSVLNTTPTHQLFTLYQDLYLTLQSPTLIEPIHIRLDSLILNHRNNVQPLSEVLSQLGNDTLETVDRVPQFEKRSIEYLDAFRAGYHIETSVPYGHPSSIVHPNERTELVLGRSHTDMKRFYKYCMVSVNGYYHCLDTDNQKVYVLNGGASLLRSRQNHIGITSFEHLCQLKYVPIKENMLFKVDQQDYLSRRAYFDLSDYDTQNKTVLFVIGGYLYLPSEHQVRKWNDHVFMIDFNSVPILERYFESLQYLDMSSLELTKYVHDFEQIHLKEFFSDEHFSKYLTLPQSFAVILDTPYLFSQKHFVRHNQFPGIFTTYKEPKLPLITSNGRLAEYWKMYEDGHWQMNVSDAYWQHRQAFSVPKEKMVVMTPANLPYQTFYNSNGYLLELYTNKEI